MNKTSISTRLNSDIVKWLDSKAVKGKTRSDVLNEALASAKIMDQNQEQAREQKDHAELLAKGARAAIMSLRILEVATKQHSEMAAEILQKAKILSQKEIKVTQPEAELES